MPEVKDEAQNLDKEESQRLVDLQCVFCGSVDVWNKKFTLVNRCNQRMAATIYWKKYGSDEFLRTYKVPALSLKKLDMEQDIQSFRLVAENPC